MHHGFFERVNHIKGLTALNGLQMPAHTKGYALKNGPRTLFNQFKFEMFAIAPYHLSGTVVKNPSRNKKGLGVTGTKGLHSTDGSGECSAFVLVSQIRIDIQDGFLLHVLEGRDRSARETWSVRRSMRAVDVLLR